MSDTWICQRDGCGHNSSQHAYEWNKFQGRWDTYCTVDHFGPSGKERCRCAAFLSEADAEIEAHARMVCSCTHHVDEHYWSPGGQIQGVCHYTDQADGLPSCGCREYDGPELVEAATVKESTTCG